MIQEKPLPKLRELELLATEIRIFPITGLGIVQWAEHLGYDDKTVDFLKLFSSRMVFNSRSDLVYHCSLLERLMHEADCAPIEQLRSPQD